MKSSGLREYFSEDASIATYTYPYKSKLRMLVSETAKPEQYYASLKGKKGAFRESNTK